MDHLHARILPRLLQDTIHCLWLAHDQVDQGLKSETRRAIMSLRKADVTDTAMAMSILRDLSPHLVRVERTLEDLERPFTAKKVRGVRDRVEHLTTPS
jgi:hypothetical protein